MGNVSRVMVTGASGFIGRATVDAALQAGLEVVAVQRSPGRDRDRVSYVSADLTLPNAVSVLTKAMQNCDAVIHLAAAMSGGADQHRTLTINGTQALLAAMEQSGVRHLTLASSIAVFDTMQVPVGQDLTAECPLVNPDSPRDPYSGAKVAQEALVRTARLESLAVIRPGIVYDAEHLWNAHLGVGLGPILFRIGDTSPLPMCHVTRCAAALVEATLRKSGETTVLLDAQLPTRGDVVDALKQTGWPLMVFPFPWQVLWAIARAMTPIERKLPGLLRRPILRQRLVPMGLRFAPPSFADALPNPAPDWGGTS